MIKRLKKIAIYTAVLPVKFYQLTISPLTGPTCRHTPTCSQYTIDAIKEWGIIKGWWMGIKRIVRCHPWGSYGYDPVPKKTIKPNKN